MQRDMRTCRQKRHRFERKICLSWTSKVRIRQGIRLQRKERVAAMMIFLFPIKNGEGVLRGI